MANDPLHIATEAAVQLTQIADLLRSGADPELVAQQADANSTTLMQAIETSEPVEAPTGLMVPTRVLEFETVPAPPVEPPVEVVDPPVDPPVEVVDPPVEVVDPPVEVVDPPVDPPVE